MFKILVTNLGSTSTKAAIYHDDTCAFSTTLRHSSEEIGRFNRVLDQKQFRKQRMEEWILSLGVSIKDLDCICVRGGVVKPLPGGIYTVSSEVVNDILDERYGTHVTNVGNLIGYEWGKEYQKPVIFVDAPITDELSVLARYSGHKLISRRSVFHALNQKQMARQYAKETNQDVNKLRLVVAHMGGGISVGAHKYGQVVDVNNALDGEGPFSPERAGSLTSIGVLELVQMFKGDIEQVKKQIIGQGGMVSYLQTNNVQHVIESFSTSDESKRVIDAMCYQVAKEIGSMATVLRGKVDQIILTGGLAYNDYIVAQIKRRVEFIADITVYPGEDELYALAQGALRFLRNEEEAQSYV